MGKKNNCVTVLADRNYIKHFPIFYKQLREKHLCNSFGKNDFCKYCPDWSNTSWPHDEKKSYADLVEKILYKENDKQNILL